MSKFCGNCGTQLPDEANCCSNCGFNVAPAQQSVQQSVNTAAEAPASTTPGDAAVVAVKEKTAVFVEKMKTDSKFRGIVLGAVAGVIALIVVLVLVLGGGYTEAIDNYLDARFEGDIDAYEDMFPDSLVESVEAKYREFDFDDLVDEFRERVNSAALADYDYEVLDEIEVTGEDFEELKYDLVEFGVPSDDITEIMKVKVEVELSYQGKNQKSNQNFTLVEIDGDWYVYEVLEEFVNEIEDRYGYNYDYDE